MCLSLVVILFFHPIYGSVLLTCNLKVATVHVSESINCHQCCGYCFLTDFAMMEITQVCIVATLLYVFVCSASPVICKMYVYGNGLHIFISVHEHQNLESQMAVIAELEMQWFAPGQKCWILCLML